MKLPRWLITLFGCATITSLLFAMSDRDDAIKGRVTFYQFSRFFLHLGCEDVLYLDGDISTMLVDPKADAKFISNTFAGMFFIAE